MASGQDNARNLKSMTEIESVRLRPGNIFGTKDEYGAAHGVEEVIANSADEAREGYGKRIEVIFDEDGTVTVEDDGRGLPMDWNEDEGKYNWELALCTLHASGKFDSSQYGDSTGLNGLGLTATQYASEYMEVWSTYEYGNQGLKTRYISFHKGVPDGEMKILDPVKDCTGTKIRFKPDAEVFPALETTRLPADFFIDMFRKQAMLINGLKIVVSHPDIREGERLVILYEDGIKEFIDKSVDRTILKETAYYEQETYGSDNIGGKIQQESYMLKMNMAFNFSRDTQILEVYQNGSLLFVQNNNKAVNAVKNAFVNALSVFAITNGKMGRNDQFIWRDLESLVTAVVVAKAPGHLVWFVNQTKGAITNPFIISSLETFVTNSLLNYLGNNKDVAIKVINEALVNKQAREESDKISKKVVQSLSKAVGFGSKPKDFVDCTTKDVRRREIFFVEGRSAKGATVKARDAEFQAVFPLRGKPINALKEKLARVLSNDIVVDSLRILGCGIEAKSEYIENLPPFDIRKLNFDKIIICTDADVDGRHIRTLMITLFYILCPSLLKYGKVYIAETPLFEMSYKDETRFAFDESEKLKYIEEFRAMGARDNQIDIQRSKGLGENEPEMMWLSTMNPLTRRLTRVEYPTNDEMVATYFNALLGDDIETRRFLIDEYFEMTENAE